MFLDNQVLVPSDLEELYQLYARDIDEGQLIQDLKSNFDYLNDFPLNRLSLGHSPRPAPGGKSSTILPFLSQIAEEDLTSASTSVTSFHLPNSVVRRTNPPVTLPPTRTLSDQDLFTRVNDEINGETGIDSTSTTNKPISYAHFNFDQSNKPQLTKGNSMVSMSSESVDVPIQHTDTTRRKIRANSPPLDPTTEGSGMFLKNNKVRLRKQTQDIAARAAQRRAKLHHQELMEDMGEKNQQQHFFLHDCAFSLGSVFSSEPVASKENTASAFGLEITGVKPKKTVTINDQAIVSIS